MNSGKKGIRKREKSKKKRDKKIKKEKRKVLGKNLMFQLNC